MIPFLFDYFDILHDKNKLV